MEKFITAYLDSDYLDKDNNFDVNNDNVDDYKEKIIKDEILKKIKEKVVEKMKKSIKTFRIFKNGKFSPKIYHSGWKGDSSAKIKTYKISKLAPKVSLIFDFLRSAVKIRSVYLKEKTVLSEPLWETVGSEVFSTIGSTMGSMIGSTIGSVFPVVGTYIGGLVGGFIGGKLGKKLGQISGKFLFNRFFSHKNQNNSKDN